MKKIFVLSVFMSMCLAVFAQDFKVIKVIGKVLSGEGNKITVGQILTSSSEVNVGVSSVLIVESEGKSYTIKAMRKGKISTLIFSENGTNGSGEIKEVSDASSSVKKGASTAASRAENDEEEGEDDSWQF